MIRHIETRLGSPYKYVIDEQNPHLGGNIVDGDPCCVTPKLWDWLIKEFNVKSVLDVGCGEGQSLDYFVSRGCVGIGIEGLKENLNKSKNNIILQDLTAGPVIISNIDLVWCCELVEHIPEWFVPNLVKTLTNGRIIAMTHADIGQAGHHHVNCKPSSYWIKIMLDFGYDYLEDKTQLARGMADTLVCEFISHFRRSGLIFKSRELG